MEISRSTEVRVGVVSIAGLVLLIVGIMLGKGINFSPTAVSLKVRLPASGGLEIGSPIVVNGVKRGTVNSVVNSGTSVLAMGEVDNAQDIHPDATAVVSILEITGGKKLEIKPGVQRGTLDVNREIPGSVALDIGAAMNMLGEVAPDASRLLRRLDTISASITELLADGSVMANLKSISADGAMLAKDARAFINENKAPLSNTIKDVQSLVAEVRVAVKNNEPKLSKLLDNIDRKVDSLSGTLKKADKMLVSADSLVLKVNEVIQEVRNGKGAVSMLLYDEAFRTKLDNTISSLETFIKNAGEYGVNVNVGLGHEP